MLPDWIVGLSGWAYGLLVLGCLLTALLRKREPSQALGWALAIVFLPVIGPLFFLLFGWNRVSRTLRVKRTHHGQWVEDERIAALAAHVGDLHHVEPLEGRWGGLSRMLEDLGQGPRRGGNAVELYEDGTRAFEAMGEAIAAAKEHVHVEFFIFRGDDLGRRAIGLLADKVREGVEVRVIVDALGSIGGWKALRELQQAGGRVESFLAPLRRPVSPQLRNHRKAVICDGRVAFFGGLNVGREYLGRWWQKGSEWCDLHVRVEGAAVWNLQWMFVEDWDYCTGEFLGVPRYFPPIEAMGDSALQVLVGGPDTRPNPIRQAFLGAFSRAERSILVVTPYLVPDLALRDALKLAAMTGVEVDLVTLSSPPDKWWPYWCGWYYTEELSAAGVRVWSHEPGMMHAKAVVVDGEWAMLGTANLDNRSMFLNFEQMAVFDRKADVERIEAALQRIRGRSVLRDPAEVARRSWPWRLVVQTSRLLAPIL
ncbi:MAG: cardiolipin synthase [Planctomycetota bacterium]